MCGVFFVVVSFLYRLGVALMLAITHFDKSHVMYWTLLCRGQSGNDSIFRKCFCVGSVSVYDPVCTEIKMTQLSHRWRDIVTRCDQIIHITGQIVLNWWIAYLWFKACPQAEKVCFLLDIDFTSYSEESCSKERSPLLLIIIHYNWCMLLSEHIRTLSIMWEYFCKIVWKNK